MSPDRTDRIRAALVRAYGAASEVTTIPARRRATGQALVEVAAAALNYCDLWAASGTYPDLAPELPYVPGADRSLIDPPGFIPSSFTHTSAVPGSTTRSSRTIGVRPMPASTRREWPASSGRCSVIAEFR